MTTTDNTEGTTDMPRSAVATATNYPALPLAWRQKLLAFRTARAQRKEVDRQARELKCSTDQQRDEIAEAMGGAPVATCGRLTITLKQGKDSTPTLTLKDGRKIEVGSIRSLVLADGKRVAGDDIVAVYGGRAGSLELDVIGD